MKYIIKKIAALTITLLVVSFLTFTAFQVIPGDSALTALGVNANPQRLDALREELGLNRNIALRYTNWLSNVVVGDFGTSFQYDIPVKELIGERLPVTASLAVLSIILIILGSIPLGILAARHSGGLIDRIIVLFGQIGMAIPPFFLGILITLVFGIILKWFAPGRYVGINEDPFGYLYYLIFPGIAIAIPKISMLVRFLRSSVLRQLKQGYVRTARSKGLTEGEVLYHHVLKNAMIPVITFLAMMIADVLAGSIIVEQVFNLPGLGRLLVVAISNRDYPVVQAIVLYITIVVLIMNFMVDLLYQYIDPRVQM